MNKWFESSPHELKQPLEKLVNLAGDNWPDDKWAFLYSYARKSLDEEIERFQRIDDKSVKLLSSVSVIITIFVALFKWVIEDSNTDFSLYVYVVGIALFGALGMSWFFFFNALKLQLTPRMPLDDKVFSLVNDKNMATIHVALYKSCQNAVEISRENVEKKAKKLKHGYTATSFSALFLVAFIAMVSYESSVSKNNLYIKKECIIMPDNEESKPYQIPSSNEPDLDVTAPDLQLVTNSDDTPLDTKGTIILESDD